MHNNVKTRPGGTGCLSASVAGIGLLTSYDRRVPPTHWLTSSQCHPAGSHLSVAPKARKTLGGRAILPALLALLAFPPAGHGDDLDLNKLFHESIPVSPSIGVVYAYADAMLEHGRDTYGPQQTGMLLGALDRKTLKPLDTRPAAPAGLSEGRRPGAAGKPLVGSNLQMDQNLLRLLYFLKGLSGEDRYPEAADAGLKWILNHGQSSNTGLLAWGEHLCWDVMADQVASGAEQPLHEFSRPWMLWERCFELAPQQSKRFALGLWGAELRGARFHRARHVGNVPHGQPLSPAADFDRANTRPATDCPRQAGFFIRTWAEAFAHTDDETFLKAIDVVLTRYEGMRSLADADSEDVLSPLSMAIDCDGAARRVPQPLRSRLTAFAARQDARFCSLPHDLTGRRGFVKSLNPAGTAAEASYTSQWDPRHGRHTTASVGVMCMSRYENTGAVGYRQLIVAAADVYLDSLPGDDVDAWPLSFGQAITLELAAWRVTAQRKYHARAIKLAEIAIEEFFGDSPLPRASLKSDHYESTTGADTLVLALTELHLSTLTITAVRTPANTIDR